MKRSELKAIVEQMVDEILKDKLEEKIEAMFYKTLVESNFMPSMISTIMEGVRDIPSNNRPIVESVRSVSFSEPVQISQTVPPIQEYEEQQYEHVEVLPQSLQASPYFEGTAPLTEGQSAGMYEGNVPPSLIKEGGLDLDIFSSVKGAWKKDMKKMRSGD